MSNSFDRLRAEDERAKGARQEYVYELEVTSEGGTDATPLKGSVLLRLAMERSPFSRTRGGEELPEGTWKYLIRTHQRLEAGGAVVREPFSGSVPFAVTGLGPWDPHPSGGLDPDELAAGLLAHFSDWRNPTEPLTVEQQEWFHHFGPAVVAAMPEEDSRKAWLRERRSPQE